MIYLDSSALVKLALSEPESGALTSFLATRADQALVSLTHDLLDNAATAPPAGLPTTSAIHLASALAIKRDLTAFVCYDKQLSDAAQAAGLPVAAPA